MKVERIVLGGGCFWCTEAVFSMPMGVESAEPGYAGGTAKDPTYEGVCSGDTGHAEVLMVGYNPNVISLETLLDVFFEMHDPTSLNRQGEDEGTQYRSIILCTGKAQKEAVERYIESRKNDYGRRIVTEVGILGEFYAAEEYHRRYYERNRGQAYCELVISPKIARIRKEFGKEISRFL
jgi:peptide-methionine (S)-S-oxide reductase